MTTVDSGAAVPAPNQEHCTVAETVVRIGEQLPYAIAILSAPEFHYEYINSHYQALAPGKVMLHRPFAEVWPEVADDCLSLMRRVLDSGLPFNENHAQYNLRRAPDSTPEPVFVSYSWVPLPAREGGFHQLLAIGAETPPLPLTSLQRVHQSETLRLLAAGIAHDFNNLLTTMLGYSWLGLAAEPAGSRAANYFAAIRRSADQAAALTRQMLAYAGQGRTLLAPIQLSGTVAETVRLLRHSVPPQIRVELELAGALPEFTADPRQIEQLITNLVLNSIEAIGDKPGAITIRTTAEEFDEVRLNHEFAQHDLVPGTYVVLEVVDTGSGIDPAILPRIFEPFFTTHFTGRGLGLAAVDGIVRACRGGIRVDSTPGRPTTFRIYLPAGRLAPPAGTTGH